MKENTLLGMPTLIELKSLRENIGFCRSLGLGLLEMNMNLPFLQPDSLRKADLPGDLSFSLHLPEELNVWDFNPKVRSAYIDTLRETIEIADSKNIQILNMHMNRGVYFTLPEGKVYLFEEYSDFYRKKTEEFSFLIGKFLEGSDIKLHIENTGHLRIPFIRRAVSDLLQKECFVLTWDIGHDASSGFRDRDFYQSHLDKVRHLHLHDARGNRNHLPLGEGEIAIEEILNEAGEFADSIVLETKTCAGLRKSLDFLRSKYNNIRFT